MTEPLMLETPSDEMTVLDLRPGELVRVRSASEIFGTLDSQGELDNPVHAGDAEVLRS